MIELKNIDLSFSDQQIFQNLNIKIDSGEKLCFSGASGRGKSTLLKMLQGYILPDSGQILIDDLMVSPQNIRQIRNKMVWIPQNINLPVNNGIELLHLMKIEQNLDLVKSIAKKLLIEEDILKKDFTKISGGQKQRVIISICLSIDRDIILMDEPTASLDTESIDALLLLLSDYQEKTIISASHNDQWMKNFGKVIAL